MTVYVALLRAVNVGGTSRLPMAALKAMCEAAGFEAVRTYIASGNVVFSAAGSEREVKAALEERLLIHAGRPVGVVIRSADEIRGILEANPFPDAPPDRTVAICLDAAPPADTLQRLKGRQDEEVRLGKREIYVAYGAGMGRSKLAIPAAATGTARNMNTIAKLAELAAAM